MSTDNDSHLCVIWKSNARYLASGRDFVDLWSARAGGEYRVTNSAKATLEQSQNFTPEQKVLLTNWLVKQRQSGVDRPVLTTDVLDSVRFGSRVGVSERIDRLLFWLTKNLPELGRNIALGSVQGNAAYQKVDTEIELLGAALGSLNQHETVEVLNLAEKSGLIEIARNVGDVGGRVSLALNGYQRIEALERLLPSNKQAFVAMWFSDEMFKIYDEAIAPAIRDSKYEPVLINRKHHNNKIDDEIVSEIRRSKFVVADFTTKFEELRDESGKAISKIAPARGGVYFEAGFALGLGRPVIWCARNDVVDAGQLHFDTRQFAHIVWTDAGDLRKQLKDRIMATQGEGPL